MRLDETLSSNNSLNGQGKKRLYIKFIISKKIFIVDSK